MRYLLDTHALVWWLEDSPRLGKSARDAMMSDERRILVSAVSAMEITTKFRRGKWPEIEFLVRNFTSSLVEEGFDSLEISIEHALLAGSMPIDHKDPFDRLLIAQARIEDVTLLSNETIFDDYGVRRIW